MPYDLSFWGVLRRPLLFSIYLLFLFPLYGVDSICVIVLYFCLYKYDEYQLVKFIIGAKGLQFLTAGLICGALGFSKLFICVTSSDETLCSRKAPGGHPTFYFEMLLFFVRLNLVWISFIMLWKFDSINSGRQNMLAFRARRSALEAAGGFNDTALLRRGMLPKPCANLILYLGWAAVVAAAARGLSCLYHAGSDVETADDFFFGGDGVGGGLRYEPRDDSLRAAVTAQAKRRLVTGCWDAFGIAFALVQLPLAYGLTVRPAVWADRVSYIMKASFVALLVCGYGAAKLYFLLTPEVAHSVYYRAPDGGAGPVEELFAHKYRIALLSAGATLALAALALPIYFALYCKAYLARREDKYHMAAIDVVMTAFENKTGKDKAVTQSEFVYAMKQHFDDKTVKQVWRHDLSWHELASSRLSHFSHTPCSALYRCGRASTPTKTGSSPRSRSPRCSASATSSSNSPPTSSRLYWRRSLGRKGRMRRWTRRGSTTWTCSNSRSVCLSSTRRS